MKPTELIGREFVQGPNPVSVDGIVAFGRGINDDDPRATDARRNDLVAHPMFIATTVIPGTGTVLFQGDLGINVNRIVHGGIEIRFHRRARPGDDLRTIAALEGIEDKGSGMLVSIRYRTLDQNDRIVVDGVTRYFSRGSKKSSDEAKAEAAPATAGAKPDFETLVVTDREQSIRYAEGSGDRFPIHTDDDFARSVGLPGKIMHGMCTLAMSVNAILAVAASGDRDRLRAVSCRFSHIVIPGDTLSVVGYRSGNDVAFETYTSAGKRAITAGTLVLG